MNDLLALDYPTMLGSHIKNGPHQRIWQGGKAQAMEKNALSEHGFTQKLVDTLTNCLAELDLLGAHVAGAHLDSALQALQRQMAMATYTSNPD